MVEEEIERLNEKFKTNFFQIEKMLAGYDERLNNIEKAFTKSKDINKKIKDSEKALEEKQKELEIILTKKNEKMINKKLNDLLGNQSKDFREIEKNIRERIERVEYLGSRLEEIEKLIKEFDKKSEDWQIFREDLERDKNLYLELRKVVLASVEKLKNFEKLFSENLEEFGEINDRVEEDEKLFEKLSAETKKELQELDSERIRVEQNVEEFKNKLKERLTKKFADLDFRLENEIKSKIKEQDTLLSSYGGKFTKLENNMKGIENDIIPKKIDMEFNEMLLILNNKLKDLITKQDFDLLKAKLENKVEQIRKPEIEPLEKRISAMEEDIDELKRLLRGISQRLPVIVE
jgi:hypothetical protein